MHFLSLHQGECKQQQDDDDNVESSQQKFNIWETLSNNDLTPNQHLLVPCSVSLKMWAQKSLNAYILIK